ncbi:hypothetical protein Z969_10030 [Clostridium novyi A str. 4570]|uniref:Uncharacterized protein n=1 Tax=Clostridium novyi A str. 4570 TaxID=1444290 RepID=A0AA88ZK08_CLONO|nr:hypothetical protein [Clostridium novyi]KGN00179.1 hypothetical protein Z969_10030 [Clostridium novyi A str. 4570]
MLNEDYKQQAISDLKKIDLQYTNVFKKAVLDMERLQHIRTISVKTIQYIERYIIGLANRPRNYDTKIGEIKIRYVKFRDAMKEIQELERMQKGRHSAESVGIAGVLIGTGTAAFAPNAAIAVAMTFGTASTGTAIASLSGAAATNAALAWLGGGAIAAGGAGVVGGQILLTMAGPVGWIIGGVSLAGSLIAINLSNKEIAKKTEESIATIKKEMERIKEIDSQVISWNNETKILSNKLMQQLNRLKMNRKRDYNQFTENELNELASLMNSTEVLSKKIGETISGRNR